MRLAAVAARAVDAIRLCARVCRERREDFLRDVRWRRRSWSRRERSLAVELEGEDAPGVLRACFGVVAAREAAAAHHRDVLLAADRVADRTGRHGVRRLVRPQAFAARRVEGDELARDRAAAL